MSSISLLRTTPPGPPSDAASWGYAARSHFFPQLVVTVVQSFRPSGPWDRGRPSQPPPPLSGPLLWGPWVGEAPRGAFKNEIKESTA